jgi:spermidine/putrescine transport system permease protein
MLRTLWLSIAATALCIVISAPVGYYMARASERLRGWLLLLVVVPFWTNFLIRVYAWRVVAHVNGYWHKFLEIIGLIGEDELLQGPATILIALVYSYLPFAILPIYAAAEKFDFNLLDAARDLGATPLTAFRKIFLPGIRRGIESAALMVFIPCLGAYVIPDLLGGQNSEMLGTIIYRRAMQDHDIPQSGMLASVLTIAVVALLALDLWRKRKAEREMGASNDVGIF